MYEKENLWFEEFFEAINQFTGILDVQGRVIKVNRTALEITGASLPELIGQPLWEIPWPAMSKKNRQTLKRAVDLAASGVIVWDEMKFRGHGKQKIIINISIKPILSQNGALQFMIVEGRDVTVYSRTKDALQESEARFKTIFNEAGFGIVIMDMNGSILDCNPAFQTMLGYTLGELAQKDFLQITNPSDQEISQTLFSELISGQRTSYCLESHYFHKNGSLVSGRISTSLVFGPNHQIRFVIGLVENLDERKKVEVEINELHQRLMRGRETERLRVAQDLHDGPLQEIIGATIQLKALEKAIVNQSDREQLQSVQNTLQRLTRSLRTVCSELRPPTLIPFGLKKAILSHAVEFQNAHPEIDLILELDYDGQILSEQSRLVFFRIYQEALNNIIRHAHASKVWIRLHMEAEQTILEVQDNGAGFTLPNRWIKLARQGHLGLVGAIERAKEIGGEVEITSAPGEGTQIRAIAQIQEAQFNMAEEEKS